MLPFNIDWKNPNYNEIFEYRLFLIDQIRRDKKKLNILKMHYKEHPEDLIEDWGCTFDPRRAKNKLSPIVPFILFPRQREWVQWTMERWRFDEPGMTVKSRDCGISWLMVSFFGSLAVTYFNLNLGLGSRKATYVDDGGSPKSLFYKARKFIQFLPLEFRGGFDVYNKSHTKRNLIEIPETGSTIVGEAGDGIGRGDRTSIYGVDESAFIEHPETIDASLSATTDCRIDVSTPCGMANSFATKVHSGAVKVFFFHWRDDPRKDRDWYDKKCKEIDNPIIIAQELDLSFTASVSGILIPMEYIEAAIDSHMVIGCDISGIKIGAFDVADEGKDKCSYAGRHGILVNFLEQWTGKGSDTFESTQKCFMYADLENHEFFYYDGDGLGAGVKGDSRVINESRVEAGNSLIEVKMYRGSGAIFEPNGEMIKKRKNSDFFENFKAQSYWSLMERFKKTYRWIKEGKKCDLGECISISSKINHLNQLKIELNQVIYKQSKSGKVMIDKTPDGMKSPNLADSLVMVYNPSIERLSRWDSWGD